MNDQLKTELRRMGIGWFILRYASERGVQIGTSLYYGSSNSQKTREAAYERTRSFHQKMIDELLTTGLNNKVAAGDPVLNVNAILKIANQI
ncbi:MAG: hypothetical protein IKH41_05075 [Clostridia bacterium]|nr:hypothetical protein [Clostridia bacterium]